MNTTHPTTAAELLAYLAVRPYVLEKCSHPKVKAEGVLKFVRRGDGGLWFATADGRERYLPLDCGKVAAETGLTFGPMGFAATKFGVTVYYTYLPDGEP